MHRQLGQQWNPLAQLAAVGTRHSAAIAIGSRNNEGLEELRRSLLGSHASFVAAWFGLLDPEGCGFVEREDFLFACRQLGSFDGDAAAACLFEKLADGRSSLTLATLDPEAERLITEFALFIRTHLHSIDEAFRPEFTMAVARRCGETQETVDLQVFRRACLEMGYTPSVSFRTLFGLVADAAGGGSAVPLAKLRFLERWRRTAHEEHSPRRRPSDAVPTLPMDMLLHKALQRHAPLDEICRLVADGSNPNGRRPGPLLRVSEGADPEILAANAPSPDTALIQAAERGSAEHVRLLLENRADPCLCNVRGKTPLHCAAERPKGRTDATLLVHMLCASRADPNARSSEGATPLRVACFAGRPEVVALLCHLNADPNVRDSGTRSCLYFTVSQGDLSCCRALLDAQADPCRADDKGGLPAISYAIERRQDQLAELMGRKVRQCFALMLPASLEALRRQNEVYHGLDPEDADRHDEGFRSSSLQSATRARRTVEAYLLAGAPPQGLAKAINSWRARLTQSLPLSDGNDAGRRPSEALDTWPEAHPSSLANWPTPAAPTHCRTQSVADATASSATQRDRHQAGAAASSRTAPLKASAGYPFLQAYLRPAAWDPGA
ncbi:unnamed protein product [Polarella glacialis]|uniref:Uncharacterized protein n=1 Tax=Polarella glacialis TaxID=89957 RepID=A0A813DUT4_POLGL|nr:unnamed protein product [Polarella glacialis]